MEKVLVSVIMPAYNSADTIAQAVDSALAQNVPLEVIIVLDASPDDTETVLARYRDDARVRILRNELNQGVAAARNRGMDAAEGRYIAFLDADDWWEAGKLAAQLKLMQEKKVVLCCTGRELMYPDGRSRGRVIPVAESITYRSLLRENCINCSSVLVRTDVVRRFRMEHDDAHEDYILWLKILKEYGRAAGIPDPYLKYRLSSEGKSGSKAKSARMTYRVYRYMGYGRLRSAVYFLSYAFHGFRKYYGSEGRKAKGPENRWTRRSNI